MTPISGNQYWCIRHPYLKTKHKWPWLGTYTVYTHPILKYTVCYLTDVEGEPETKQWVYVTPEDMFETEEDAKEAYTIAEAARVEALHEKWALAAKTLGILKSSDLTNKDS